MERVVRDLQSCEVQRALGMGLKVTSLPVVGAQLALALCPPATEIRTGS